MKILLAALLCSVGLPPAVHADGPKGVVGEVVGISDGDTLTLLVNQVPQRIRLAMVDAPESKQPFGQVAKKNLAHHAFRKVARANCQQKPDHYGRNVCEVFIGDLSLNQLQVRDGMAWVYREYVPPSAMAMLLSLETEARYARKGLWQGNQPVAPWEFRKQRRDSVKQESQ